MKSCEATGKTIEQAIESALKTLNAKREDVDIKIISEGGFLKKAKVKVTIAQEEQEVKPKKEIIQDEEDADFIKNFISSKISLDDFKDNKKVEKVQEKEETNTEIKQEPEEKIEETLKEETVKNLEDTQDIKPVKIKKEISAEEFIEGLLSTLGKKGTIERKEEDGRVTYSIYGENLNELIGKRGECLNNLSYIFSLAVQENHKRLCLDVENYREKRKESLERLAVSVANKVAKSGRYAKLEPMPANERRIIHAKLADDNRVTTMSKGTEPKRYLMVFPVGEDK